MISSKPDVYALTRAENAGIRTYTASRKSFDSREAFEARFLEILERERIELIVLAGFPVHPVAGVYRALPERIINVHPALIPSFCGEGFYGLRVHEAALEKGREGDRRHRPFSTTKSPDGGRIIAQKAVCVEDGDTPERLQKRVMEQAEWLILPAATETVSRQIAERKNEK